MYLSALNCTHCHHQDAEMTEIDRGKSNWCKTRTTAALPQGKARQCLGCGEAMTINAISSTYKFFQDNSLELFKDGSPRKQEFNPIYFFRVLKRSLINLHVLLTKCPNSPSSALESCGGTNNSQSNIRQ